MWSVGQNQLGQWLQRDTFSTRNLKRQWMSAKGKKASSPRLHPHEWDPGFLPDHPGMESCPRSTCEISHEGCVVYNLSRNNLRKRTHLKTHTCIISQLFPGVPQREEPSLLLKEIIWKMTTQEMITQQLISIQHLFLAQKWPVQKERSEGSRH